MGESRNSGGPSWRRTLGASLALTLALMSVGPTAAEGGYGVINEWGSKGGGPGKFRVPVDIAIGPDGDVYVGDKSIVQRFSPRGVLLDRWRLRESSAENSSSVGGIAVDSLGRVYVADNGNSRVQLYGRDGSFTRQWGARGEGLGDDGPGEFFGIERLAIDSQDNLYVLDQFNFRIQKFDRDGRFIRTWGDQGESGPLFRYPTGLAVAPDDSILVGDVELAEVKRFDADGRFLDAWSSRASRPAFFADLATGPEGEIYVLDYSPQITRFGVDGELLARFGKKGADRGELRLPAALALDDAGRIYVVDTRNHRIQVFRELLVQVRAQERQTVARPSLAVSCPEEACRVRLKGEATIRGGGGAVALAKGPRLSRFKLKPTTVSLAAGEERDVALRFRSAQRLSRQIRQRDSAAKATIAVRATKPLLEIRPTRLSIRLRGARR